MRVFRAVGLCCLWFAAAAVPSMAATYAWPVQLSQQVTVTNFSLPTSSDLVLYCYIGTRGAIIPMAVGTAVLPKNPVQNGGGFSYSGTLSVAVSPPGPAAPPEAGMVAACGLRVRAGAQLTAVGSDSVLTLP